ncbi:FMN-binding negative transcriptional regulator [Caenimonas sp. SL110]|uniref:FMN-binding negative transcriptional regulator n=1 Tax=Caenimonas sp. SL110 TaxID=1450524 RepID=UPI0006545666|nr:FMN-binding negative transcriptional regulator [Caenimonas sp. SL110]
MYLPPHFKSTDPAVAATLMRENAFASLISNDDDGFPFVTHLPLHLSVEGGQGDQFVLWGHCAKPNPHWRYLQDRPEALAVFIGPDAYQSPKIYADKARVPSWNYVAVHCKVQARLIEDNAAKDALLKKLIGDHEPTYAQQWRDLGEDFANKMLPGIVGFELRVLQWQCKLKINQHRPESREALHSGYLAGGDDERALAGWMDRLKPGA